MGKSFNFGFFYVELDVDMQRLCGSTLLFFINNIGIIFARIKFMLRKITARATFNYIGMLRLSLPITLEMFSLYVNYKKTALI